MKTLFVSHFYLFLAAYLVVITALAFLAVRLFRHKWTTPGRGRTLALKLSISVFSILYLFVALEAAFAYLFVQSDAFGFTLSCKRWFHRHWNPINSAYYRDYEPVLKENILYVVGDSFVAGHGIEKVSDRFSNILGERLGESWCVAMLAENGWNTLEYVKVLANQGAKPDTIIVSYYVNDIQSAASSNGIPAPALEKTPPALLRPLVDWSYLVNWAYWKIYRTNLDTNLLSNYLERAYNDEKVWKTHTAELDALIAYANGANARIAFVIWPHLADVAGSETITSRVSDYLTGKGVTAIDLGKRFKGRDAKSLTVNSIDSHPNRSVHAEVARLLHETLWPAE